MAKTGDSLPDGSKVLFAPNPGPQTRFLASTVYEILFGGQAGGGKSMAAIAMPLRWVNNPAYRGVILRRESTQLGNLLDKAQKLYRPSFPGAFHHGTENRWYFPSGANVRFGHCKDEADKFNYQGDEFHTIFFDELTHFTEGQFTEIASRIRSPEPGLPRHLRASSNPGGPGHDWVLRRFGAWLNPEFEAEGLPVRKAPDGRRLPPAAPGQVLWILKPKDGAEVYVPRGTPKAKSRLFLPSTLADNPALLAEDPDYETRLYDLDPVRRAQLLEGNWLARPAAGLYFKRAWVEWMDPSEVPEGILWVRAWDLASTPVTDGNKDPAWTVGVKVGIWRRRDAAGRPDDRVIVADAKRVRMDPGGVEATIRQTAEEDGKRVRITLPLDPGQAGVSQSAAFQKLLLGWPVSFLRPTGDKLTRFLPFSAQASPRGGTRGRVILVRGAWTQPYCECLESFPDGAFKDDADATSDGFNEAVKLGAGRPINNATGGERRSMDGYG